ncbi:three component ABC system middle component [Burkholderia ambifaria]|uniref:three component ABC system middle component n=1 Tax=Burkholderia ambifaria TaxID=152480 RepID=UPI002013BB69|nr:three component ABC system middle component [Burkholderia ambifaria]
MLARETQNVQNPALGAALIWRFCCAYVESNRINAPPPLPLLFLVLPIILHQATSDFVQRTYKSSGLRAFAAKFGDSSISKQDLLIQIHDRSIRWRKLSMQSVELAVAGRLLKLADNGDAIPLSRTKARGLSDEVKHLMDLSEKLGAWFGKLTVHEIVTTLKVRL